MAVSWRKAIVSPRDVPELDPTNSRCPSFNYPKSRIELASVLSIITWFWRIRCIWSRKEESENDSFWSASFLSNSWLALRIFFCTLTAFDYSSPTSPPHLSTCCSLLFTKLRERSQGNGSFDLKGSWWWCKGDVEVLFKIWLFSLPFGLGSNSIKKDSTPTVNIRKQLNLNLMTTSFIFIGEGGVNNFRVTLLWKDINLAELRLYSCSVLPCLHQNRISVLTELFRHEHPRNVTLSHAEQ